MSPSNESPNSQRRHPKLSSIDDFWWVCMLPSICIGLGFGLVALVVAVLVSEAKYPMPMTTKLVLQATALLAHLLAAAIAAYVAPLRKMTSGMLSGLMSLVPSWLLVLVALGLEALLIMWPLLAALLTESFAILIGTAIGAGLSRLVMARQARSLPLNQ